MLRQKALLILTLALLVVQACKKDKDLSPQCDTANVSFSQDILPILENNCFNGCHNGSNPNSGFLLETYNDVKKKVDDGRLLGAVKQEPGFVAMPLNRAPINACQQSLIEAWINQGAPNN